MALRKTFNELNDSFKEQIAPEAEKVREAGGLFILGTERHDSRRIDNQLRGRAGRQGDPGASRFFVSMEDNLMRLFGGERIYNMMETLGVDENTPIDSKLLSNSLESAQKRVESQNFAIRKSVLQFDDVMNQQRTIIYDQRNQVLEGENLKSSIMKMVDDTIKNACSLYVGGEDPEAWNLEGLRGYFCDWLCSRDDFKYSPDELKSVSRDSIENDLLKRAHDKYEQREEEFGSDIMRELERMVLLRSVDTHWMDHIDAMDELRDGMRLRAYAQHDPVQEYRNEGFDMFNAMTESICEETTKMMLTLQVKKKEDVERKQVAKVTGESSSDGTVSKTVVKTKSQKVGRNDPCPCGSGKKYKKCCGADK